MKKIILLAGSVLLLAAFSLKREKAFVPPGTVNINDTLFADETEVSNFSWQEYVKWTSSIYGKDSIMYKFVLPDTLVWRDSKTYNEAYVSCYYSHPAYKNYPVVGISYAQARAFCMWRTERVHVYLEIKEGKRKPEDRNRPYTGKLRFEYRLPTKQEWEALAMPGLDEKKLHESQKNLQKYNVVNISSVSFAGSTYDNSDVTAPVYSYWPNKLGIYNVIGNVNEMVSEKGISKGGGWKTHSEDLSIWKDEEFSKPNAWTGFRCVCVIKK